MVPHSSGIVRRCGASREKSCGGNAAKNRLNFPCSNRRATGGVPYGIEIGSCFKTATPRRLSQARIAFTDSALCSAYRSDDEMSVGRKSSDDAAAASSKATLSPARQDNQMRGRTAGRLVCDAVNVVRRRARELGEGDQAAGANPYTFADETDGRKLVSQLLIALEQSFGLFLHR